MITPKYKVGDICVIIGGEPKENIGKQVVLDKWLAPGEIVILRLPPGQGGIRVAADPAGSWLVKGDGLVLGPIQDRPVGQEYMIVNYLAPEERHLIKIGDTDPDLSIIKEKELVQ